MSYILLSFRVVNYLQHFIDRLKVSFRRYPDSVTTIREYGVHEQHLSRVVLLVRVVDT
jgi:hypothetical protein